MLGVVKGDKGKIRHVMRLDQKGAQAVVASNAATLAMTAAVSQQLAAIEQQLADITATLETMVRENDAKRLANVVATNQALMGIADAVRRRGITATDMTKLAALDLPVITNQLEAEFKFADLLGGDRDRLSRADRVKRLEEIASNERLEYWLTVRIQADLAQTRLDLLSFQWEVTQHPETTRELSEGTRTAIETRQARLHELGDALQDLTDASSRTKLDPVRQLARRRLGRESRLMRALLAAHGDVFLAPTEHPYAILGSESTVDRLSPEEPSA